MSLRETIDFLLYEWINVQQLCHRPRFGDHSSETFNAVMDMCERIAREKVAPHNRAMDTDEPQFDGDKVILPQVTYEVHRAYADSGMLGAAQDYDFGGMQLPYTVEVAANSFFTLASANMASTLLTASNANLLVAHGTTRQKEIFARNELSGRWSGTMCLSEPQAGSSLSDVLTRAVPDGDDFEQDPLGPRYRIAGNKMWITAGDHELTENIVHLVLAKIPDADGRLIPGIKGLSLFVVPKKMVDADGRLTGERNDVTLAGLNHKLGWRGTTNALLNFGEGKFPIRRQSGAVGYRVGRPHEGLACMFHMMNQARIGLGSSATMLGLAGYYAAVDYAKNRSQGRPLGAAGKDPARPQVRIIEHTDVKRMLLAQKAYCEGALALGLYCARLVDEQRTGSTEAAEDARLLLEVLTPIAKSWPSEWCLEANSLAIQVHGGYGYTRDFPVEQYWRDNRLNMIHEGTHGVQAIDLLGRKVLMENGRGLKLLTARISETVERATRRSEFEEFARDLTRAVQQIIAATESAWATRDPEEALANAVPFMQAFGHMVLAWIWLDVVLAIPANSSDVSANLGKRAAAQFFYRYELSKIDPWLSVVSSRDLTCARVPEDAF